MSSVARKLLQVQPSAAEAASDDDFANVVLLLDGDGTAGDDNNTFTDSGSLGGTVTATGDVVQGSFSPYGNNWSVYFDGSNDRLDVGSSGVTNIGSGDFTVEFWINSTDTSCNLLNPDSGTGTGYWGLMIQSGDLRWNNSYNVANKWVVDGAPILDGDWHHVAVVRYNNAFKVFYDGASQSVQSGSFSDTTNYSGSDGLRIGEGNLNDFQGYLSNVRIVSGTAIYQNTFDPPTEPFTPSASYTEKALVCQSNRFIDNGDSNRDVVTSGTPRITPFSPFKNDDARDITVDGGSANFDNDELLTIADNVALDVSGQMTAEAWIYVTDMPDGNIGATGQGFVLSRWVATGNQRSWGIFLGNNGQTSFYTSSSGGSSYTVSSSAGGLIQLYRWHHIAVSWDGFNQRLFVDGDLKTTTANTLGPFSTASAPFCANALNTNLTGSNMNMYIADARYFPDTCIYVDSFDLPTAPISTEGGANEIAGASYSGTSFDVQTEETSVQGIRFGDSGTKMYVIGNSSDTVYQYTLTTAYDISTASYASKSFDVGTQDGTPKGVAFKSDGTKMYVCGQSSQAILQYSLSTAWDVSTASYDNVSRDVSGRDTQPQDITFKPDGTRMFFCGNSTDDIYQMDLSTAWDVSTATGSQKLAGDDATVQGHVLNSDGTRLYVCGIDQDGVYQYNLSTAWDITTGTLAGFFSTASEENSPRALEINPDGTQLFVAGTLNDEIFEYDLNTINPTVLLNFQDAGIYDRTGINNVDTVSTAQIDTAVTKYGTGSIEFDGSFGYLKTIGNEALELGSGDWTIEFWVYFDAVNNGTVKYLFDWRTAADTSNSFLAQEGTNGWTYWNASGSSVNEGFTTSTFSASTWHHVAIAREGSNIYFFVDGTKTSGSVSDTSNYDSGTLVIGSRYNGQNYLDGYIDDFRITKGVARYTADFTPPTAALPKF